MQNGIPAMRIGTTTMTGDHTPSVANWPVHLGYSYAMNNHNLADLARK